MGMALDEPREDDSTFEIDGFRYIVNNDLLEKAKPIRIDFVTMGFKIDSSMQFDRTTGCEGCSCG